MDIHAIRTGTVRVKQRYVAARWRRRPARYADILLDREWSEPLPVYAWVVDHPQGVVVVDAGATTATYDTRRFDRVTRLFMRRSVWIDVAPEEEVGPQLRQLGIDPDDVRWVVQTHLHADHADGVAYFRNADVVVSPTEWETAQECRRGCVGHTWPSWVRTHVVDYDGSFGPFPRSSVLTDGIVVVATPGHTPGHQSVILHDDCAILLAGDLTFTQQQLLDRTVSGIVDDYGSASETIDRVRRFVSDTPTVYLPAHDPEAPDRLRQRKTVRLRGVEAVRPPV